MVSFSTHFWVIRLINLTSESVQPAVCTVFQRSLCAVCSLCSVQFAITSVAVAQLLVCSSSSSHSDNSCSMYKMLLQNQNVAVNSKFDSKFNLIIQLCLRQAPLLILLIQNLKKRLNLTHSLKCIGQGHINKREYALVTKSLKSFVNIFVHKKILVVSPKHILVMESRKLKET